MGFREGGFFGYSSGLSRGDELTRTHDREKWVYFIEKGHPEGVVWEIKIGIAYNPYARLKTLQTANTERLVLLAKESGGKVRESELHRQFAHLRIAGKGHSRKKSEWFEPGVDLLDYIESLQSTEGGAT